MKRTSERDEKMKAEAMAQRDSEAGQVAKGAAGQVVQETAKQDSNAALVMELTADLQRTRADFENYRKQIEAQRENDRKATRLATIYKMLTLLDDVDRAITTYDELKPLEKSLKKTFDDLGLKKIDSTKGAEFNPDLHDAVMVEGDGEKEVIAETLRPGYYYEGEVLRAAMVKVQKVA